MKDVIMKDSLEKPLIDEAEYLVTFTYRGDVSHLNGKLVFLICSYFEANEEFPQSAMVPVDNEVWGELYSWDSSILLKDINFEKGVSNGKL
jgi:hypothetical protein